VSFYFFHAMNSWYKWWIEGHPYCMSVNPVLQDADWIRNTAFFNQRAVSVRVFYYLYDRCIDMIHCYARPRGAWAWHWDGSPHLPNLGPMRQLIKNKRFFICALKCNQINLTQNNKRNNLCKSPNFPRPQKEQRKYRCLPYLPRRKQG